MAVSALTIPVLELDRNWAPTKAISMADAFRKVMKGVAEFVDVYEDAYGQYSFDSWMDLSEYRVEFEQKNHNWIQAVNRKILAPYIIRVLNYSHKERGIVKFSRQNIFKRDKYACQYCGKQMPGEHLNLDHVIPRKQGGITCWENIVCSCIKCNTYKGGRTPKQAQMRMIKIPKKPAWSVDLELPRKRPSSWAAFVSDAYWNIELEE